ncbi:tetratricopeptide repeat protein [Pseudodesulfovibrio cashew]|uniref:tetratricopeptide repeat protein n=1 Tax=Pseudodesulfovibrio cashew TaxID=2678688 RepID=UPI001F55A228|nr:tetratricopeptide repeat protein [Pseudodesulfovibrio cashew]
MLPDVDVRRTGPESVVVGLPSDIWDTEPKPSGRDYPGKLVKGLKTIPGGLELTLGTNAFGYIKVPVPGKPQLVLQIFRDPIGARWKAPDAPPARQAAPAKPTPGPALTPAPAPAPGAAPAVEPPAVAESTGAVQQPAVPAETELPADDGQHKPFFAVPYSVRNQVTPPGATPQETPSASGGPVTSPQAVQPAPQAVQPISKPELSGVDQGVYPEGSELRFKAVNKTADEVKFAELAGTGSAGVASAIEPQATQGAGQVGGSVASPSSAVVSEVSGDGQAGGGVTPPSSSVAVSGEGQAGGGVTTPPTVVQGAPPPEPTPEEAGQQLSVQEQMAQHEGATAPPAETGEAATPATGQESAAAPGEGATAEAPGMDNATAQAKAREEAIRSQLYEAQSLMFNGALDKALPMYEDILKQPDVPDDVREETLYAVADIKKEIHKDELSDYFDEISQAYLEAMNANLRSNRVPRALLNLGLINLQVGNFPEAKAYFKILQEKYPDDNNIPSISYYWGEYYYRKGDYKKAADQFQYLIQTYPEHELVKQAAFYLADSLNRTGFVDQAFQIVDYIDKRWPDYYMENPQFLRLAGNVEMKLSKWPQAKNHFFTYYNLNPEADGADVVLARLGDVYVRQGQKDAARQIYEKTIADYPDKEGGLVAKMRLAEEGIYDAPAMDDMASVFNRPYNKRPENIYKEIVEGHPDSPLAPIAQLKLAMWYAYNKKYPEALSAAQDFIEKYPKSPLIDRARRLGDSVFALAVPGMVGEERYGRVVRYWETYDFIGQEDTRVDERTRLNVALSYWKVGQPEKALEIIKPYLTKRQMPGISDEALGLAVNIYLDQLAWKDIADLVAMAKNNWKLKPAQLRQLDYARAMSLQNLGEDNQAQVLWAELAKDTAVEPAFRAYAMYYMAKAAMERQDLRKVFVYSQEALSLLLQTDGDPEKIKDAVLMSIYATERSGRYEEALKWAREYDKYITPDNPEWASTRFKLARIYRKAGAMDEWKQLLTDIIEKKPDSLQAQLAKSALDTYALEQQVQQYSPAPQ